MQGNCTDAAPSGLKPPTNPRQCVLTVRSDGFDASGSGALVLEALYIRVGTLGDSSPSAPRKDGGAGSQSQSSLVVRGPTELYLLGVTLLGSFGALPSRGLEIPAGGKVFAGGEHLVNCPYREPSEKENELCILGTTACLTSRTMYLDVLEVNATSYGGCPCRIGSGCKSMDLQIIHKCGEI
jgi:hypothetical protein